MSLNFKNLINDVNKKKEEREQNKIFFKWLNFREDTKESPLKTIILPRYSDGEEVEFYKIRTSYRINGSLYSRPVDDGVNIFEDVENDLVQEMFNNSRNVLSYAKKLKDIGSPMDFQQYKNCVVKKEELVQINILNLNTDRVELLTLSTKNALDFLSNIFSHLSENNYEYNNIVGFKNIFPVGFYTENYSPHFMMFKNKIEELDNKEKILEKISRQEEFISTVNYTSEDLVRDIEETVNQQENILKIMENKYNRLMGIKNNPSSNKNETSFGKNNKTSSFENELNKFDDFDDDDVKVETPDDNPFGDIEGSEDDEFSFGD